MYSQYFCLEKESILEASISQRRKNSSPKEEEGSRTGVLVGMPYINIQAVGGERCGDCVYDNPGFSILGM
jgi:hypothetical protein